MSTEIFEEAKLKIVRRWTNEGAKHKYKTAKSFNVLIFFLICKAIFASLDENKIGTKKSWPLIVKN